MWNLDIHPFELALRALAVYALLLLMMRITGRRTVGQFTPFDLLVVMLVSEAAGPSMTGSDQSLPGGLLVCVVLIALNTAVGFVTARWRGAEKLLALDLALLHFVHLALLLSLIGLRGLGPFAVDFIVRFLRCISAPDWSLLQGLSEKISFPETSLH
ncbi:MULTISPECIES: DUF421 domain-containing protein [Delftia]|jgi:uncharacterized membrane protein YcaP (DUF421 family)|nr:MULTISPECIES: hypothetical protein [Delftia]MDH0850862.1 hypothetical protein [Delftia tsuruhatensis]WEL95695.1 hypothetical protein PW274_16610 [Delftia tsuruhatensis]WQM80185.1 hypothetical protein RNT40_15810 [Delftia tsuruhatensis]